MFSDKFPGAKKQQKNLMAVLLLKIPLLKNLKQWQMNKLLNLKTWLLQSLHICLDLAHTKDLLNNLVYFADWKQER